MRAILDTSVLIGELPPPDNVEAAISVASIAELHFGVLVADDDGERARRTARLAVIEATFDPIPVTAEVARVLGATCGRSDPSRGKSKTAPDRPCHCRHGPSGRSATRYREHR